MRSYEIRTITKEIANNGTSGKVEIKRIRVYKSIQHIWNEVIFTVSKKNANLAGDWRDERGARIIFN